MPNVTFIDQYISDGRKELVRQENLKTTALICDESLSSFYRTTFDDFFIQHHTELRQSLMLCRIPLEMYYRPKSVSKQIYGTVELWPALLRANDMKSIADFHYPIINVYAPMRLKQLIDVYFKRDGKE